MTHQLIIIGAGGFGRELHAMLGDVFPAEQFTFKGFLAQEATELSRPLGPVLAPPDDYVPQDQDRFLLAIGDMPARERITRLLEERGGRFATFIHPRAYIAPTATIGTGAVIYPFAVVSNQAHLDGHVHLNYFASVGHDARVGACSLLAPYATLNGTTVLERGVYMSTHATVVVGKRVGAGAKVSANSTVQHDVPPGGFVFGVPGRVVGGPSRLG